MIIVDNQNFNDCDFCGQSPHGRVTKSTHGAIAQGATGRWCIVMSVCDECIGGSEVTPVQTARDNIDASGNGYADF